jgi:[NiFe] hydrogenase assembly HybE family chaperone
MRRLRTPASTPHAPPPAVPLADDPSAALVAHFDKVWRDSMQDMSFVNPALQVEAVGFRRHDGDWVGALITPWFLNLFVLPGGGALWQDLPTGEQRSVDFPVGKLDFIADNNPGAPIGAYQYCPLLHPVQQVPDQAAARDAALAALAGLFAPQANASQLSAESAAPAPVADSLPSGAPTAPARRAFLGGFAGRRGNR